MRVFWFQPENLLYANAKEDAPLKLGTSPIPVLRQCVLFFKLEIQNRGSKWEIELGKNVCQHWLREEETLVNRTAVPCLLSGMLSLPKV